MIKKVLFIGLFYSLDKNIIHGRDLFHKAMHLGKVNQAFQ